MSSNLIILDGPSGSGKTTLVKEMQELLTPEVWMNISVDSIIYTLPPSILNRCNNENNWDGINNNIIFAGAILAIEGVIQQGGKGIFDAVITTPKRANQIINAFKEYSPIYIGVSCSWEKLEARTLSRKDRTIKEAKFGYENTPKHLDYAYQINSSDKTPQQLAKECIGFLSTGQKLKTL